MAVWRYLPPACHRLYGSVPCIPDRNSDHDGLSWNSLCSGDDRGPGIRGGHHMEDPQIRSGICGRIQSACAVIKQSQQWWTEVILCPLLDVKQEGELL